MTGKAKSQSRARNASVRLTAGRASSPGKWSQTVMKKSDVMDLRAGVFKLKSARAVADPLQRSSEASELTCYG
jgi:hypothetical protein